MSFRNQGSLLIASLEPNFRWSSVRTFTLSDPQRMVMDLLLEGAVDSGKALSPLDSAEPSSGIHPNLGPEETVLPEQQFAGKQTQREGVLLGWLPPALILSAVWIACLSATALLLTLRTVRKPVPTGCETALDELYRQEIADIDGAIQELVSQYQSFHMREEG